jgi:hypothetical protein
MMPSGQSSSKDCSIVVPFELPADFEGLAPVSAPVEQLQAMVFE